MAAWVLWALAGAMAARLALLVVGD